MLAVLIALTIATPVLWSILIGTVIPTLTDVLTKAGAPAWLKAVLNALLAAAGGVLAGALSANTLDAAHWEQVVLSIAVAWVASVASYFGIYKPTGLSNKLQSATANFGISA